MKTKEEVLLEMKVSNKILEFIYSIVDDYDEITTSDLQGMCQVVAMDIIKVVKEQRQRKGLL